MKKNRYEDFQVGLIALGAILLLVVLVIMYKDVGFWRNAYVLEVIFDNAGGLNSGAPVYMSGVRSGQVASVTLSKGRAHVQIAVTEGVEISDNAVFGVSSVGPMGEKCLEIYYRDQPSGNLVRAGDTIQGESPPLMVDLLAGVQALLDDVGETAESLRRIVAPDDGAGDLKEILTFGRSTMEAASKTVSDIQETAVAIRSRTDDAAVAFLKVLASLQKDLDQNRDRLTALMDDVEVIAGSARGALEGKDIEIRDTIGRLAVISERIDSTLDSFLSGEESLDVEVKRILSSLKNSGENLEVITGEARKMFDSDEIRADVHNATAQVTSIARTVDEIFDTVNRTAFNFDYTLRFEDTDKVFQSDIHLKIGPADSFELFRMGLEDIGGINAIDLQTMSRRGSFGRRAGIMSSKVGVGMDYYLTDDFVCSVELIDTRRPYMNLTTNYKITRNYDLMLSLRHLFREQSLNVGIVQHF